MALPGPAFPPLNLSAPATSGAKNGDFFGGTSSPISQGDWIVTTGSGSNGLTVNPLLWMAIGAGVLWIMKRKQKAA